MVSKYTELQIQCYQLNKLLAFLVTFYYLVNRINQLIYQFYLFPFKIYCLQMELFPNV